MQVNKKEKVKPSLETTDQVQKNGYVETVIANLVIYFNFKNVLFYKRFQI